MNGFNLNGKDAQNIYDSWVFMYSISPQALHWQYCLQKNGKMFRHSGNNVKIIWTQKSWNGLGLYAFLLYFRF